MEVFRLILSIEILIFHTSNLLGVIGYSAVFGFYLMSGYAVTLVLDKKYENDLGKFWIHRILKLYPSYLAVLAVSMLLYYISNNQVIISAQSEKLFPAALDVYHIKDLLSEIFLGYRLTGQGTISYVFNGFPKMIGQAWTHSVYLFFYLTAPFLVKLWKKNPMYYFFIFVLNLIYPVSTYFMGLDFSIYRYRSVFGTYFIFMIGGFIYFLQDKFPDLKYKKILFSILQCIYLSFFAFGSDKGELIEGKIWGCAILEVCILIITTEKTAWGGVKFQKVCSYLSMGIYLTQALAKAMIMILCASHDTFATILGWGTDFIIIPVLFVTLILTLLLYYFVDKPLEKLKI